MTSANNGAVSRSSFSSSELLSHCFTFYYKRVKFVNEAAE